MFLDPQSRMIRIPSRTMCEEELMVFRCESRTSDCDGAETFILCAVLMMLRLT